MLETKILDEKVLDNKKVIFQTIKKIYNDKGDFLIRQKIILPYLTDDELLARYRRIKPIVSIDEIYYYLKRYNVDMMRNHSYLWDVQKDIREQVDMSDAQTLAEFPCYHTYGFVGYFKPSIAEILQQFPDDVLDEANAFYMISSPENEYDLNMQSAIVNAGCHQSVVKALKLKK